MNVLKNYKLNKESFLERDIFKEEEKKKSLWLRFWGVSLFEYNIKSYAKKKVLEKGSFLILVVIGFYFSKLLFDKF